MMMKKLVMVDLSRTKDRLSFVRSRARHTHISSTPHGLAVHVGDFLATFDCRPVVACSGSHTAHCEKLTTYESKRRNERCGSKGGGEHANAAGNSGAWREQVQKKKAP